MNDVRLKDFENEFTDNDACLEWLKNRLYPDGIKCPKCQRITMHHKVSGRSCYACDNCGNHVYPAAGTIFRKSTTPLKIWFAIIQLLNIRKDITAQEIQQEFGLTYKNAKRMLLKIRSFLDENHPNFFEVGIDKTPRRDIRLRHRHSKIQKRKPTTSSVQKKLGKNGIEYYRKRDRIARLLKVQMLLAQSSQGLTIKEIANKCATSKRTVYRDLAALETEIGVPIWEEGCRRGVVEGCFLPLFTLTEEEATTVFIALSLIQNYIYNYNPFLVSTFNKIGMIAHESLKVLSQDH